MKFSILCSADQLALGGKSSSVTQVLTDWLKAHTQNGVLFYDQAKKFKAAVDQLEIDYPSLTSAAVKERN